MKYFINPSCKKEGGRGFNKKILNAVRLLTYLPFLPNENYLHVFTFKERYCYSKFYITV